MNDLFSPKQLEFILGATAKWNMAHGSVSTGKTEGVTFRFMEAVDKNPDSLICISGHSSASIYNNVIQNIFSSPRMATFAPFCTWFPGKQVLTYKDKRIICLGAKDEGSIGKFQGQTLSLCYCDEITLYPETLIDMIDTRLRLPHSMAFATMNPSHPDHKIKKWIDAGIAGDKNYYSVHFTIDDNPFLPPEYKERIKNSTSGLFYKRNYLGLWCLAEGAIYDFFDPKIHVVERAPACADYYIAGIDYGTSNAFACVLIGVSTGQRTQTGKVLWVEKEYYWDSKKTRQKTNSEYAEDVAEFLEPYAVKQIYIDPSALSFKLELQRRGMHPVDANNDVLNGLQKTCSEMRKGNLFIMSDCKNLIREVQGYTWDPKKSIRGYDEPLKKDDHACDALRYAIATHKPSVYDPYGEQKRRDEWLKTRYNR